MEIPAAATLRELISAIATTDWDEGISGEDCAFLWGRVWEGPGLAPLYVVAESGEHAISGYVACDDEAIEQALPLPSGLFIGWRGDSLLMTHGSDISDSSPFDSASRSTLTEDPRVRASYVFVAVSGNEETLAVKALATFIEVTETFGAAMLPIGPRVLAGGASR